MEATSPELCSPDDYKKGMRRLLGGVTLVCSRDGERRVGMTATAVSSVCAEPPTLLVCLNRAGSTCAAISNSGVLSVNVLAPEPEALELARRFSRPMIDADRFDGSQWTELATGAPVFVDSAASFDCEVVETADMGSHRIFFARVRSVSVADDDTVLGYLNGEFVVPTPLVSRSPARPPPCGCR